MSPLDLTIAQVGASLRAGDLTSTELTRAHLDRIALADPSLHAFVAVTAERALAEAERADRDLARGVDRGPLHGIPVALKDLIDLEGVPTTCGSRLRAGHVATEDAAVARRLARAGAVTLGKLATYEFALTGPSFDGPQPPSVNPWSPGHVTGGSSSGAAAAVASGLTRAAIGTDTGGSIRSPAAYCGVVGLKPSFGRVPTRGVFPLAPSLDHVGPLAATVADAAVTLDAIAEPGPPAAGLLDRGVEGLRIGYARDWFAHDPDAMPEVVSAMDDAASRLSLLGARIEEVALPDYAVMEAAGAVILHAEAMEIHLARLADRTAEYGRGARRSLLAGLVLGPGDVAAARRVAARLRAEIDAALARHDALVTACTLTTAPPLSAFDGERPVWTPMRTLPFDLTGHPALSVPIGFAKGLPMGMQIVGRHADEGGICRVGAAFERATDHAARRPPAVGPAQALD